MHLRLRWRILVSTTDGENVCIEPHDRDGEKNTKPSKDILPKMQNLRQILRKYNQQEEFRKANFNTFRYLHAEYFVNPDVETWRERNR
jgi:hypothetical protein